VTQPTLAVHQVTAETWHLVLPLVEKWLSSKHCPHTGPEIVSNLEDGSWTLWAVVQGRHILGLYAVRIFTTARGKFMEMPFLVGEKVRQWWQIADAEVDRLGRAEGCSKILLTGRKGWERVTRGRFRVAAVVIEREVGNG
jgi:hypothetical protein